ncbi:reverse transcriptase domain-containing protein, partial [Tanacetum coccineum]
DLEVTIGGTLSAERWTELCSLLKKNLDIFTWKLSDMTGVLRSVAEHRLNIREGYSPVRAKVIQAEVHKLVEVGIMREVYYHDWLSNPVMVKKHDGSWRMCVDFTDLNKACPQDCYPLPEIDWKVESLCGYPFKCFLDAYKGYHQIQMAENLLMNKEKLFELAKILLNENCSAMLLKKLPEKLRDPGKFLIPCNFSGMDVCHALADLGASINLMPLSFWKKLSLPELTPTRMTLELADRSITHPKGLAEDVYVKMGKFYFPIDFVVVDFEADPRVSLILRRSFLRTGCALIDVYGEEITLRVDNEAATFNLDQTMRYSFTNEKSVNRIDIIDAVCEECAPELLGFSNNDSSGGNPTPTSESFTSEFILEEIKAYLKDNSISPEIDYAECDPEEDICLIKKLLNNDPFQLPPMDLKQSEVTEAKYSIKEPPELELKDLPSHLEYAFLEENNKLPVIIAKGLKNDEKDALLKVLKSHKRAIA